MGSTEAHALVPPRPQAAHGRSSLDGFPWEAVDGFLDRTERVDDLIAHGVGVLAARRRRKLGQPVPEALAELERRAELITLTTPVLLDRVRESYDARLLVLKGAEVAARYPEGLRAYGDLDLLVDDAGEAHRALRAAGAEPVGDPELYVDIHHLRPLAWPDLPLAVELHSRPKWPDGLVGPSAAAVFAAARPASLEVPGFLAPAPAAHALLLAGHSWAHEPLRRLRDLVDVAVLAAEADPAELRALARDWRADRLWRSTEAVVSALFDCGRRPLALRLWAPHLQRVRGRTVLENHLQRWLSDWWLLPPPAAARRVPRILVSEIGPGTDETWAAKLGRSSLAFRHAHRRRVEHDEVLRRRQEP